MTDAEREASRIVTERFNKPEDLFDKNDRWLMARITEALQRAEQRGFNKALNDVWEVLG